MCFTLVTPHLPLSRDSRNGLQFYSLLKYSLLKQRGYCISETKMVNIQWNQKQTCKKKIREILFNHISEPLQFLEARCVLKPIPVDSKCGGTHSVVFDILHEKLRWKTSLKSVSTTGQELKSIANKAELNKEFRIRKGMQMPVCTSAT